MTAKRIGLGLAFTLVAITAAVYFYVQSQKPLLQLGVGYAARVACGCRHIGNRSLEDCYKDFEPGMEPIRLSEDSATKTVTASVPFIVSRSARYDPVLGCLVEKLP